MRSSIRYLFIFTSMLLNTRSKIWYSENKILGKSVVLVDRVYFALHFCLTIILKLKDERTLFGSGHVGGISATATANAIPVNSPSYSPYGESEDSSEIGRRFKMFLFDSDDLSGVPCSISHANDDNAPSASATAVVSPADGIDPPSLQTDRRYECASLLEYFSSYFKKFFVWEFAANFNKSNFTSNYLRKIFLFAAVLQYWFDLVKLFAVFAHRRVSHPIQV